MKHIFKAATLIMMGFCTLTTGCDDYLDVSSETEFTETDLFSDETGYRDALIGSYLLMGEQQLYGAYLTWMVPELLAQQYSNRDGYGNYLRIQNANYTESPLASLTTSIWTAGYNLIANLNNIIAHEAENGSVMRALEDSLIMGECYGLRAYMHFDLLRMYGKGNIAARGIAGETSLPYVKTFSKLVTPSSTYTEYINFLLDDLDRAISLLACDPILGARDSLYYLPVAHNGFVSTNPVERKTRMNYYAAKALKARVLMWQGTDAARQEAAQIALDVINSSLATGATKWTEETNMLGSGSNTNDNSFYNEHIFSLFIENYTTLKASLAVFHISQIATWDEIYLDGNRVKKIYETDVYGESDWRKTKDLEQTYPDMDRFAINKNRNGALLGVDNYTSRVPLIRLSEMCYIAAEVLADSNPRQAVALLNTVRNHRNLGTEFNLPESLTAAEIRAEVKKEYLKEFLTEGQLFYYYKRLGDTDVIDWVGAPWTDDQFVFPMPESERTNGGRQPLTY